MVQVTKDQKGGSLIEAILVIEIVLLIFIQGYLKILLPKKDELKRIQEWRLPYDGIKLWKD